MLVVTDICPIGVRDRVRGTLWLTGWLAAVPGPEVVEALVAMAEVRPVECLLDVGTSARLLELHLHDVILSDRVGTTDVPAGAATPGRAPRSAHRAHRRPAGPAERPVHRPAGRPGQPWVEPAAR